MSWIVSAAVILAVAAIVMVKIFQKGEAEPADYPYQKTGVLFSPAERSFLGVLTQVIGETAEIFGKVRVADVVAPRKGLSRSDWQKAFNKIAGKHFDFLLCSNDDLSVICAIELDDSSHHLNNRQKRDEFLNGVCNAAGIPLIRVPAKMGYVITDVKQLIAPHFIKEFQNQDASNPSQQSVKIQKVCPQCASPMVIRVAKKGSNAGKPFWACSAFPKCRHIEAIKEGNPQGIGE